MHAPLATPMPSAPASSSIDPAIARGVAFLARARDPHGGLWRDFSEADGSRGSDVWISGFVAAHLGAVPQARPLAAAVARSLAALPRASGGWGYDQQLLEDADSTAWVLLAARRSGVALSREQRLASLRFLLRHEDPRGGFVTYGPRGQTIFGHVAQREGWFSPQVCVSASVLTALAAYASPDLPSIDATARDLLARSGPDHLWHPYWWHGFTYATHHVVDALLQTGHLQADRSAVITRAVLDARNDDGGWSGQHPDRSNAFATALALLTLCALEREHPGPSSAERLAAIGRASQRLRAWQGDDGCFAPSAELLVPGGSHSGPMTMVDRGVFTTGCALHALHDAHERTEASR
ncbi:MAG: terpene cyclase/mutase family protein [Acidimicrobiales bacterium]|nr:terpene cyclase/mutase family protein [Acidimicrobiales bacterium]MCB9713543.1 terpene cyclase/mutase family protein [Myxococcales bacterium]